MNRFVIADPTLCIGCHTCEAACSENHRQHGLQSQPRLKVMRNNTDSAPQLCHHCEDAPCAQVCPVNAITRINGAIHNLPKMTKLMIDGKALYIHRANFQIIDKELLD